MHALSVRVLGELAVPEVDVARLDRKARTLLLLLALARGRPVSVDRLTEALWEGQRPRKPHAQVAVLVSRLRRELGRDRVEHVDSGYRLRADRLDLDELETVVDEAERRSGVGEVTGAAAAARLALALARGPVPDIDIAAEWAVSEHAAAVRLVRRARRVAAEALAAAGHWLDVVDLAEADVLADPLDEWAVRTLIRAQAACGRPGRALAAYASLRVALAEQLGTDPSPDTQQLHLAVLRGELGHETTAPAPTVTELVGRTSQCSHLDALVARTRAESVTRVAAVVGEAGIGKTTFLDTWSRARRSAGDRVLTGRCRPLDRAAPLDVVLTAVSEHLRQAADGDALLGEEAVVLAPLLGIDEARGTPAPRTVDPVLGPTTLFASVAAVLARIGADQGAVLVVDDAHLAGPVFADWLGYLLRRPLPLLVVVGMRPDEGPELSPTDLVTVGPLDRDQVAEIVGEGRADDLYRRSGGHPLFLSELASVPAGDLPPSLVASVAARCDQLGTAGDLVRVAAVIGGELDVELLAAVLGRPALAVLADVELAVRRGLLVEDAGRHRFRHELVREALVTGTTASRRALLHREFGRRLAERPGADPAAVADHAMRGGDRALAARWLRRAARRSAERFDHATAEELLDQSLALAPDDDALLARARVRIRRGRYRDAEADVLAAGEAGGGRWEVGAWAAYFDRRFDDAIGYAEDGALAAEDPATHTRCMVASGRILHARGDLALAEQRLRQALDGARGEELLDAAAWLGVLQAHRGQTAEAVRLMRPVTRPGVSVDHTSAYLHALLFSGHAHAVAGQPAEALDCFARYGHEVERRDVPRFAGRGVNFAGWVLRNVGATEAGIDAHREALEIAAAGDAEMHVAALQDLAEERVREADPEGAGTFLARASAALDGDLVFGWRLRMKQLLLDAQVRLLAGEAAEARLLAERLRDQAAVAGVPRYEACARLVWHRALAALGEPVDLHDAWSDLTAVEQAVRVEAWWWAGQTGFELGAERWLTRAEQLASELAQLSGPHAATLRAEVDRRLAGWRAVNAR